MDSIVMAKSSNTRKSPRQRAKAPQASSGFAEAGEPFQPEIPDRLDLQLGPGGRVVIPAVYRKAMQVEEGDRLMARVIDGELRLITPEMGIKLAQKIVRETIPPDVDLVADLLEERRREFEREMSDD
jgi:bifunctional DNA-binding transcriptional regulator/antitoxin component of YhaV-PrlF toxin-antitoxin module